MRRGIGSALLSAVETQFIDETLCDVLTSMPACVRPYYVSQGYLMLEEVVSSDGLACFEMSKRLRHA
jgi:hypothetical protein